MQPSPVLASCARESSATGAEAAVSASVRQTSPSNDQSDQAMRGAPRGATASSEKLTGRPGDSPWAAVGRGRLRYARRVPVGTSNTYRRPHRASCQRVRNEKDAPVPDLETEASHCWSGDGGNRTHVRDRVKDGFYERIRRSMSRSSVAIAGEVGRRQPQKMSPDRLRQASRGDPASDSTWPRRRLRGPRLTA
jgi:hypothetical protein